MAAKTTEAVRTTVAQKPNRIVVVFIVVIVFMFSPSSAFLNSSISFMFRFFFSFVLFSRGNPRVDVKVAVFDDEASGPLHPKVAVYFAVATGLPLYIRE